MAKDKESETKSKKYFVAFILLGIGIIGFVRINYIKESGREEREREKSRLILLYQKGNNRESAISYFVWESRSGENRKAERRDKMGQAGGSIYNKGSCATVWQCDQIGRLLKGLGDKFSNES